MTALAVGTDVLVLEDETGGVGKALTAHTCWVSGAFDCGVWLGAFHAHMGGCGRGWVRVPIKVISLTLHPRAEGGEMFSDHVSSELACVCLPSGHKGVSVPDEGGF